MSKSLQSIKAHELRRKGMSIKDIASELDVSKSTASIWCRDIVLTPDQEEELKRAMVEGGHEGRLIGAKKNRDKKLARIEHHRREGKVAIGRLSGRDLLIAGIGLYWAEGSKKQGKLVFTNSDPKLIRFMQGWFKECMGLNDKDFIPRICIHESHKDRIDEVLNFWSSLLGLPLSQFARPVFNKSKRKKAYVNRDTHYGVMALCVRRGTDLKYRILGLIEGLSGDRNNMSA